MTLSARVQKIALQRIKKHSILLKVYAKAALMMFICLLLITNTIQSMVDILFLLIGCTFLIYFILFGYKRLL